MSFYCNNCKSFIREGELDRSMFAEGVCPYCGEEDFVDASECKVCGELISIDNQFCDICSENIKNVWETAVNNLAKMNLIQYANMEQFVLDWLEREVY